MDDGDQYQPELFDVCHWRGAKRVRSGVRQQDRRRQISWLQWFLSFLPVGIILLIVAPWLSYVLYKPEVTHSAEVAAWAGGELKNMGRLSRKEWTLIGLVLLSLGLWVLVEKSSTPLPWVCWPSR